MMGADQLRAHDCDKLRLPLLCVRAVRHVVSSEGGEQRDEPVFTERSMSELLQLLNTVSLGARKVEVRTRRPAG